MNKYTESKISSTIYDRLNEMNMTPAERQTALNALHDAELIVDAFSWVARKIERLGAFLFLRPSVKH